MLPKLSHRIATTKLPSNGRTVRFRPMQGREEKLLLVAKESDTEDEILSTVKQVVANCVLDELDTEASPIFDIEWLFIQIRIESVSPTTNVTYLDKSDGRPYQFRVDLREIEVVRPPVSSLVDVDGRVKVELRWPPAAAFVSPEVMDSGTDAETAHQLALWCVDKVHSGDDVMAATDYSREELDEFVNQFDVDAYRGLMEFVAAVPTLRYTVQYTNSKGEERQVVLSTLTDFFRFR